MTLDIAQILTAEERQQVIDQRVKSWAVDLFGHQLNRTAALALDPKADTSDSDTAIAILTGAIESALPQQEAITAEIQAEA